MGCAPDSVGGHLGQPAERRRAFPAPGRVELSAQPDDLRVVVAVLVEELGVGVHDVVLVQLVLPSMASEPLIRMWSSTWLLPSKT